MIYWLPKRLFRKSATAALLILFWGAAGMVFPGCAGFTVKSPAPEVYTFFVAGHEADLLGNLCLNPGYVDLSNYAHLAGVRYPTTFRVDVLHQPPSRPFKPFAVLECDPVLGSTSAEVIEGFTKKAREIGADAIIVCQPGVNQGLPGLPPSNRMQAVAIKYKMFDQSTPKKNS